MPIIGGELMTPLIGDLLLVRDTDFISRSIERITHSPYSHVAIFTSPDALVESTGFRKVGYQDPGRYAGKADLFRCEQLTDVQRVRIAESVKSHLGQHYDYFLLILEWIRYTLGVILPWYEHDVVICSTLVADGYRDAGIDPCPNILYPSPADLALSKVFRKLGPWESGKRENLEVVAAELSTM
jgi:hypothetical protein